MLADINANFPHDLSGERMQSLRMCARAGNLEFSSRQVTQDTFGHLATGGISGTQEQDPFPVFHFAPEIGPKARISATSEKHRRADAFRYCSPQHAGLEMIPIYHRAANIIFGRAYVRLVAAEHTCQLTYVCELLSNSVREHFTKM